jgi:hypothetical protein
MLTPYILENVFRINIAFDTRANQEIVMRTFPASKINTSYSFDSAATDNPQGELNFFVCKIKRKIETWYLYSQNNDSVVATGPYIDTKGSNKSVISFSQRIVKDNATLMIVQIEVLMENLASFFESRYI